MQLISTTTVGAGGSASITFSSIPGTYTDLVLMLSARNTGSGNSFVLLQANGVTSSYETVILRGETSATSTTGTSVGVNNAVWIGMTGGSNLTGTPFSSHQVYIPNYTSTTKKTFSTDYSKESNSSSTYENGLSTGVNNITSVITSLTLTLLLSGATFAQYSTASLYGILKGSGGATAS